MSNNRGYAISKDGKHRVHWTRFYTDLHKIHDYIRQEVCYPTLIYCHCNYYIGERKLTPLVDIIVTHLHRCECGGMLKLVDEHVRKTYRWECDDCGKRYKHETLETREIEVMTKDEFKEKYNE